MKIIWISITVAIYLILCLLIIMFIGYCSDNDIDD